MSPIEKDQLIQRVLAKVRGEISVLDGYPPDVQRVLECLRDHLFEEACNVDAILECSGVLSPSLHARFKYHVGTTIRSFLEQQRLKAAKQLLQDAGLEIYLIAFSVGYANYRTFDRAFRRCLGCTPTVYREKMSRENV
ncbi:MAG: helix-turn-helix domain-containing protein [Rhodothermales bacterium]